MDELIKSPTVSDNNAIQLAVIATEVKNIKETTIRIDNSLVGLQKQIDDKYATKAEVAPLKSILYGLVSLILTAVIGAIMFMILK